MKGSVGGGTEIHVAGAGFAYVTQAPKNSGKNYSDPSPPVGSGNPPKNSLNSGNLSTWRIIPVSKWLVAPVYKPFRPFGMGITRLKGDLRSPWLLTTYPNWDDPPSSLR